MVAYQFLLRKQSKVEANIEGIIKGASKLRPIILQLQSEQYLRVTFSYNEKYFINNIVFVLFIYFIILLRNKNIYFYIFYFLKLSYSQYLSICMKHCITSSLYAIRLYTKFILIFNTIFQCYWWIHMVYFYFGV